MTAEEVQNKIEDNGAPTIIPPKIEGKEISSEEFLEIANKEGQNFKQETTDEINKLNSVDLDHQTFENIKNETGIEIKLNNLNQEVEKVIEYSKNEVTTTENNKEKSFEELKEERLKSIIDEIIQKWEEINGPKETPLSKKEIEEDKTRARLWGEEWSGMTTKLTDAYSNFYFGKNFAGNYNDSVPDMANKILKEKFPEYKIDEKEKSISETQNTPEIQEKYENKEVSDAFQEAGMPLDWKLVGMLEESQEHQGGRRGSGFTQASRYMADIVRSERSSNDFKIFDNSFRDEIEDRFFKNGNLDKLKTVDFRDYVDKNKLKEISNKIKGPGSKILLEMISDIFNSNEIDTNLAHLPSSKEKMEIGTCTTAENYFFDYMRENKMYGDNFKNKRAKMNIFKDEKGEPLFMEKIGLGENHSAISLKDFYLNGIKIPAGSLVALQYDKPSEDKLTNSKNGNIFESKILQAVEFLRFTTLVVNPKDREQTFGEHFKWQKEQDIKGAEDLTLNEVINKCKEEIAI